MRADSGAGPAWDDVPPGRIRGLSLRASTAIHQVESPDWDYFVFPGVTAEALRRYRAFLGRPGRGTLYPGYAECPCRGCLLDDVVHAREVIGMVLDRLPPRARAELRRQLTPLDAEFARRTLPDPFLRGVLRRP